MQNYFGLFHFSELKPYNSKYCSNFVLFFGLQLIFAPFNFAVLFGSRNSRNKGDANIKGFTVYRKLSAMLLVSYAVNLQM